jgi:hypothetical protein
MPASTCWAPIFGYHTVTRWQPASGSALVLAPLLVGAARHAAVERFGLRQHPQATAMSRNSCSPSASPISIEEIVSMIWGKNPVALPPSRGPPASRLFTVFSTNYPALQASS